MAAERAAEAAEWRLEAHAHGNDGTEYPLASPSDGPQASDVLPVVFMVSGSGSVVWKHTCVRERGGGVRPTVFHASAVSRGLCTTMLLCECSARRVVLCCVVLCCVCESVLSLCARDGVFLSVTSVGFVECGVTCVPFPVFAGVRCCTFASVSCAWFKWRSSSVRCTKLNRLKLDITSRR